MKIAIVYYSKTGNTKKVAELIALFGRKVRVDWPPGQIKKVVVLNKSDNPTLQSGRDILWEEFLAGAEGQRSAPEPMEANEPLFLLPTSGTTAKPKVTVQNHGGYQMYGYSMGLFS